MTGPKTSSWATVMSLLTFVQQRRLEVPAFVEVLGRLAARGHGSALLDRLLDEADAALTMCLGDQRANNRVLLERVADPFIAAKASVTFSAISS